MKKLIMAMALLMTTGINAVTYTPVTETAEASEEKKSVTEQFVVQEKTADGYLMAVSISEETNAPHGYILDDKYEVGDIVEVTYWNDDIFEEKKIVGKELEELTEEKYAWIDAIVETGDKNCAEGLIQTEDGTCVTSSFYE